MSMSEGSLLCERASAGGGRSVWPSFTYDMAADARDCDGGACVPMYALKLKRSATAPAGIVAAVAEKAHW